jgi:hypothetical protein
MLSLEGPRSLGTAVAELQQGLKVLRSISLENEPVRGSSDKEAAAYFWSQIVEIKACSHS